jgi:two-component system, LytTR family, response regulator
MKIRTVIVEDEPLARERLRNLLERDSHIDVVAECGDGMTAVAVITEHKPDLVFLDIQLPERNGFDVLSDLDSSNLPAIVFVTAYDHFAVKAFDVHAVDYLLKPFDVERFEKALARAKDQIRRRDPKVQSETIRELLGTLRPKLGGPKRISIKTSGKLIFIRTDEIDCVEAADNYVKVQSGGQIHVVRDTLSAFEGRLPTDDFVRISRSCIINIDRIKELQPLEYGEYEVVLLDGTRVRLTRGYRQNLERLRSSAGG